MNRLKARTLLEECTGRDIWSVAYCVQRGVPRDWIEQFVDCFESGFKHAGQTIYHQEQPVHQYEGVRDVDLAKRLAEFLGVDVNRAIQWSPTPESEVRALKEAVDE